MNRQIVLDTETTGLSHQNGHRIIEIAAIEMIDRSITQKNFHTYINPGRKIDESAFRVHGISSDFLKDKPVFRDILDDFIAFIDGAELIIHNAAFDIGFLEAELQKIKPHDSIHNYISVFDTLSYARQKHRGAKNNLDALCKRYQVNNAHRNLHGALLDADLLAKVYLAMTGGQIELFQEVKDETQNFSVDQNEQKIVSNSPVIYANAEELEAHKEFMEKLIS